MGKLCPVKSFKMSIVLFPRYVRGVDGEWGWRWEEKARRKHQIQVGEKRVGGREWNHRMCERCVNVTACRQRNTEGEGGRMWCERKKCMKTKQKAEADKEMYKQSWKKNEANVKLRRCLTGGGGSSFTSSLVSRTDRKSTRGTQLSSWCNKGKQSRHLTINSTTLSLNPERHEVCHPINII